MALRVLAATARTTSRLTSAMQGVTMPPRHTMGAGALMRWMSVGARETGNKSICGGMVMRGKNPLTARMEAAGSVQAMRVGWGVMGVALGSIRSPVVALCYEETGAKDGEGLERLRRALQNTFDSMNKLRREAMDNLPQIRAKTSHLLLGSRASGRRRSILKLVRKYVDMVLRAALLSLLFAPAIITLPVVYFQDERWHVWWYGILTRTLALAGPAFIKWGQWASTRLDMFPGALCNSLATLQAGAPQHSAKVTRQIIKEAFGAEPEELFESFDYEPVASGSIAQVYKAVLGESAAEATGKPIGTEVAIKVRHPGVEHILEVDFGLMMWFATALSFVPGFDELVGLEESIRQFGVPLKQQVDLSLEARSLSIFNHNFRHLKDTVVFPEPLFPMCHPSVLVETFLPGRCITEYVNQPESETRVKLAEIGVRILLKMLLVDNFIHADLHPGNILVQEQDDKSEPLKVVILDVGMTTELRKDDQINLLSFFKAITNRDGEMMAKCVLLLATSECKDEKDFSRAMNERFNTFQNEKSTDLSECITDLMNIVRKHHLSFPGDVFNALMTSVVLEGWSGKLNPDLDLLKMIQEAFVHLHRIEIFKETFSTWRPWFF